MPRMHCAARPLAGAGLVLLLGAAAPTFAQDGRKIDAENIKAPPGYRVELVADGLNYPTDLTFGPDQAIYVSETGGHTYGTDYDKVPPAKLWKIRPDGTKEEVALPHVPIDKIRNAAVVEEQSIGDVAVPTAYDIPEGIIPPLVGVTYNPRDNLFYLAHRTRYSTFNPSTGEFKTIVDNLPSWGEFLNSKAIFGPDGKMYFVQSTQGNLGPVDSHWLKVITYFNKPLAREVPCEDVTLTGRDFAVNLPDKAQIRSKFIEAKPGEEVMSGVYVPLGVRTKPGMTIPGQQKCNGAMYRANLDGTGLERVAWGLRSIFGLAFSPAGRLVVTQNSCNPIPPREVFDDWEPVYEIIPGAWYGWPDYCSSVPITDDRFKRPNDPDYKKEPQHHHFVLTEDTRSRLLKGGAPPSPLARLPIHSAAEGFVFGRSEWGMDPEDEILVALWGNIVPYLRDQDRGYKVVRVNLRTGEVADFLGNKALGPGQPPGGAGLERPIMLAWGPDGSLYVLDFGVVNITDKGMQAHPNTGALFRVVKDTGPAPSKP